ncbi:MAG: hypothetical protein ABSF76_03715 [Opitutaceae bacterium]
MEKTKQPLKLVSRYIKYWEQCWDPQVCANIPFVGNKCVGAHICVRIIEDNGTFYLEGEVNGQTARYALADSCIPAFSVGIATLEICVANINIVGGALRGLDLVVKACLGADIGPIHVGQCWDLYDQHIPFTLLSAAELQGVAELRGGEGLLPLVVTQTSHLKTTHCSCS